MRRVRAVLAAWCCGLALAAAAADVRASPGAAGEAAACGAPPELLRPDLPLPGVASGVATGRLRIFAVGSASVLGAGASGAPASWPARLETLLREALPGVAVEVQARGGRGLTTADQWDLVAEALRRDPPPDLVIWQAGATEAARGLPVDSLTDPLVAGLDRLQTRGIDTVVMDLQFSRFLRANTDVTAYREALGMAAAAASAPLFDRYELMKAWADAERVDVERTPRERRTQAVDRLNGCIGRALAAFLLDGMREARR
jgi:hypothetical protein